jgi:hypothetical protein
MANILHLARNMDDEPPDRENTHQCSPRPAHLCFLSPLVAALTADEATIHVALVAVVDYQTNAASVAVWTTSCPLA